MWRIFVFLIAFAAGFFTVGIGTLRIGTVTVMWVGLMALAVGMTVLVVAMFRMLSWVLDGPRKEKA
jgi:hypothetical protein